MKQQYNFLCCDCKISVEDFKINILSAVEWFFLNPAWHRFIAFCSPEYLFSRLFIIDVNSFPKQLNKVMGRLFSGAFGSPLFLYIGLTTPIVQLFGIIPVPSIKLNNLMWTGSRMWTVEFTCSFTMLSDPGDFLRFSSFTFLVSRIPWLADWFCFLCHRQCFRHFHY